LWHAPETAASESAPEKNPQPPAPADVRACATCGFPVSGVRTLCVDCETHQHDTRNDPSPTSELFVLEKEESWINNHGYTVASVLVSALAVAIIYWLR
jgi:hypothetical protein